MPFFEEHEMHPFYRRNPAARKRFIGLVGWGGKNKLDREAPARDMYLGALAQSSFKWMTRNCERFYILSANYHLLHPDKKIQPYPFLFKDLDELDKESWGHVTIEKLAWETELDKPILVMAGSEYIQSLVNAAKETQAKIYDPCPKMTMGMRLNWIRSYPVLSKEVVAEIKTQN